MRLFSIYNFSLKATAARTQPLSPAPPPCRPHPPDIPITMEHITTVSYSNTNISDSPWPRAGPANTNQNRSVRYTCRYVS
jgi:hypothetical protein